MTNLLINENNQLKSQLENQSKGIEGLLAQIDALKQTVNELMNTNLILRTNINMKEREAKLLNDHLNATKAELENIRQQFISKNLEDKQDAINS